MCPTGDSPGTCTRGSDASDVGTPRTYLAVVMRSAASTRTLECAPLPVVDRVSPSRNIIHELHDVCHSPSSGESVPQGVGDLHGIETMTSSWTYSNEYRQTKCVAVPLHRCLTARWLTAVQRQDEFADVFAAKQFEQCFGKSLMSPGSTSSCDRNSPVLIHLASCSTPSGYRLA
jgi:hypothetical protein